jgi:DNA-directed RNA polymerase specialized sigma24 family protein
MAKENGKQTVSAGAYAAPSDFEQIFTEDVNSLYLLSLLLTGDPEKAETCFVEGIGESTKGNHVFKEWARSWARRTIIQSAIRLISPREHPVTAIRTGNAEQVIDKVPMALHAEVCAILELVPLERFVFVMSVLERYSDNDCSILLGCARRDIATVRTRAMQRLITLLGLNRKSPAGFCPETSSENAGIDLLIAQHFTTAMIRQVNTSHF